MWFRKIEYPRVQTYAVPYITEAFYAGSVILIAFLVALNIAIVGNDTVTELKKNPNNTDDKWWAPTWLPESLSIPTTPGPCQPLTLPQHATSIRTNSTLPIFSYTLLNGLGTSQNGSAKWYDALPYRSEPLQNCTVQNITALINFQDRGHTLTAQIICDLNSNNPETPPVLKLSTKFSRMANTDLGSDDIVDYISSYAVPRSADINNAQSVLLSADTPALKMLGVLDAIGSDLLKLLWAQKWVWKLSDRNNQWPDQAVVRWSNQANCMEGDYRRRCRTQGLGVEGIDTWYSNTKGSQDWTAEYFRPMNVTIYNYIMAVRDALHLDLGNVDPQNNIFLSQDAFRARILQDPFMQRIESDVVGVQRPSPPNNPGAYTAAQFWRTCTWGWGCNARTWTEAILNNDTSAASITSGLPIHSFESSAPVVIDVDYVCPVFRVKQTGSLLVSVFIGTFSMYTAIYGIWTFIAPKLDEMYRKKHGLRRFSIYDDDDDANRQYGHLPYRYQTPPQSSDPYNTIFDAPDLRSSTDAVPRYDPVPAPKFDYSSSKRNSLLPPGAYLPATGSSVPPSDGPLPPITQVSPLGSVHSRDSSTRTAPAPARTETILPGYFEPYSLTVSESRSAESGLEGVVVAPPPARTATPVVENPEGVKVGRSFTASMVTGPSQGSGR